MFIRNGVGLKMRFLWHLERHQWCMMASEDKIMRVMDFLCQQYGYGVVPRYQKP